MADAPGLTYVPDRPAGVPDGLTPAELAVLLRADQARRWQGGERVRAEDYLRQYPALAADARAALDLIYGELLLREQHGEAPETDEYLRRFPQYEAALRRQLLLHRALACGSLRLTDVSAAAGPATTGAATLPPPPDLASPFHAAHGTKGGANVVTANSRGAAAGRSAGDAPRTIGRFRVERLLGEGGFARVFLAYDPALDRRVAIKVPHEGYRSSDFLRREAVVAGKLKHPGIVQIYEICPNPSFSPQPGDPSAYVVMQYVEGMNLAKKLETEKVSLDYAVELILDVAEALAFAHEQGVVHRDLKPQNILLDVNDRPYVADFGLAVRQETIDHHLGEGCGTPAYMSPEQAGGGPLTPASDVWSLGATFYEMLVRQRPFGSYPLEILK